ADKGETIKGDLIVYGRGDPSIAARFNNGDYFKSINDLADRIVAAGVKRVKGDLVGDESFFNGDPLGSGWEWEDLQWSYGAPVSALTINDNAIDLTIRPAEKVGAPVVITTGPPAKLFMSIVNHATTTERGSKSNLRIHRSVGSNNMAISGPLAISDSGFTGGVAIPDPALAFVSMLRDALIKRGVKIDGRVRTIAAQPSRQKVCDQLLTLVQPGEIAKLRALDKVEIARLSSPAFGGIAAQTL